jgi:hypothetical protein
MTFYGALGEGFEPGLMDPGDSRLAAFVMERDLRWASGEDAGRSLWDLRIFHPQPRSLLFSDTYFGLAPLWAIPRAAGLGYVASFHAVLGMLVALNFVAAFAGLRRTFELPRPAAWLGALLFAAGSPRVAHLFHIQLLGQFPVFGLIHGWVTAFGARAASSPATQRRAGAWIGLSWALLFHLSPYMAWFTLLAMVLAASAALFQPAGRAALGDLTRWRWQAPATAAVLAGGLVLPVAVQYLRASADVGVRSAWDAAPFLVPPDAWLYPGAGSVLYGELARRLPVAQGAFEHELRLGLGLIAPALALWGLWSRRRDPRVFWSALPVALLCLLVSRVGPLQIWTTLHPLLPGAAAFRAVSRAGLLLLAPVAVGLAAGFAAPALARRPLVMGALALVALGEQLQRPQLFSTEGWRQRTATLARALPADCQAFFYSPRAEGEPPENSQLDGVWVSLLTGIPTVNGYSGAVPPEWPFWEHALGAPGRAAELEELLASWTREKELDEICWQRGASVVRVGSAGIVVPDPVFVDGFERGSTAAWTGGP